MKQRNHNDQSIRNSNLPSTLATPKDPFDRLVQEQILAAD